MSYEIIRNIKIDEKEQKVLIKGCSNNVFPKYYNYWECFPLSKLLKEKGIEAVDIAILKDYEEGNFQKGNNKYTKAFNVLYYIFKEEYKKFNWRWDNTTYGTPEREEKERLRKSPEFDELLIKCLNYKYPKEKWVITKDNFGEKIYGKKCPTCMKWLHTSEKATKYTFKEEAEDNIYNSYKYKWSVEKLE